MLANAIAGIDQISGGRAELADGWNVPFIGADDYATKCLVLAQWCGDVDRDPAEIRRSVNVGCAPDEDSLQRQFGDIADFVRPGVLMGSTEQMVDAIGRYATAGATQINLAVRAPFEIDAIDQLAVAIERIAAS